MTTWSDYGFHFEAAGRSGYEGPNHPAEEFFTGRDISEAVARECIQNSIDAMAEAETTVSVDFILDQVATEDIPDIEGLRFAAVSAQSNAAGMQGKSNLDTAVYAMAKPVQPVLMVSDAGTTGLLGSESVDDQKSPLSVLTRGTGASSDQGDRGGSFGIGSAVGPLASHLSTVFYRTQRTDDPDLICAGLCRFSSHTGKDGEWRRAEGHLTELAAEDDFHYARGLALFPNLPSRAVPGTDVIIVGYRDADEDARLHKIRDAVVANFFAAIHHGKLRVSGRTPSERWELHSQNLLEVIESSEKLRSEVLPFYLALHDSAPSIKTLPKLGEVQLFLNEDDRLERPLGTITMRKPLMWIDTFTHRIPVGYAGVLVCASDEGNRLLREIEPPEHNKWNEKGPRSDAALVASLKTFVREELRARLKVSAGEVTHVRGLERFLPTFQSLGKSAEPGTYVNPGLGGAREEAGSASGADTSARDVAVTQPSRFRVSVNQPAVSREGGEPGGTGKHAGGPGHRGQKGGDVPTDGVPESDGRSRIRAGDVRLRSFTTKGASKTTLVLTPSVTAIGDLPLALLGVGGKPEDHEVRILSAYLHDGEDLRPLAVEGMTIKDLALIEGAPNRIEIELSTHRRYRMGVKHG